MRISSGRYARIIGMRCAFHPDDILKNVTFRSVYKHSLLVFLPTTTSLPSTKKRALTFVRAL